MTPLYQAVFPTGISRKTWFSRKKPVAGITVVLSVCICSSMARARGFNLCPLCPDVPCRGFSDIASFSIPATALPATRPQPDRSGRTEKRRPRRRVQTGSEAWQSSDSADLFAILPIALRRASAVAERTSLRAPVLRQEMITGLTPDARDSSAAEQSFLAKNALTSVAMEARFMSQY